MTAGTPPQQLFALRALSAALAAMAFTAVIGVATGNPRLSSFIVEGSPISASTGFGLFFMGLSASALAWGRRRLALIPAALVGLIGLAHLIAHLTDLHHPFHAFLNSTVYRFVPPGSTRVSLTNSVLLTSASIVLINLTRQRPRPVLLAGAGAVFFGISGARLIGYVTGSAHSFDWGATLGMSLPTALCFFLFGSALILWSRQAADRASLIVPLAASALVLMCSSGSVMILINSEQVAAARSLEAALELETATERCIATVARVEVSARNFALTGDAWFLQRQRANREAVLRELAQIEEMAAEDPLLLEHFAVVRAIIDKKIEFNHDLSHERQVRGLEAAAALMAVEPSNLNRRLVDTLEKIRAHQTNGLIEGKNRSAALVKNAQAVLVVGSLLAVGLVAAAFRQAVQSRRELEKAHDQLEQRVAERTAALSASERRALDMQTRLETVLHNSPIVMWAVDSNGIFTAADGRGLEAQGLKRDQLLGRSIFDLISENPELTDVTRRALRGEVSRAEINFRGLTFENHYGTQRNADGSVASLVCVSTDITSRKEAERLALSERSAQEASRLKSTFLANMSHEIRTPMNGVIGMSTLLRQTQLSTEQRDMADVIQNSAENLLTIIDDILDFSKIEAGKLTMEPVDTDLRAALEETLTVLAPRAFQKGIELVNDFSPLVPVRVQCDPVRLRQVVTNFVANAIKFTEAGEVVVLTECLEERPEDVLVRISVRDTGIGISTEAQAKLFEAFSQADNSITRRFGGSGLGLTISRQLIQLMGGTVGVRSELGRGSTFWCEVKFPKSVLPATAEPRPRSGLSALVVDDNLTAARVLARQLAELGVAPTVVDGAASALALLGPDKGAPDFDVVFVDDRMPDVAGAAFAGQLQLQPATADLPLVLLSSHGPAFDVSHPAFRAFSSVLAKPVRRSQLRRVLIDLLQPTGSTAPEALAQKASSPQGPALRILLAEDDRVNHMVALGMLGRMGHQVDVAVNGAEAFARFSMQPYDVVLMDCHMPVLDGYGATRKIREYESHSNRPRTPIVALTASAMAQDKLACMEAGMDDFMSKPILLDELRAVLARSARKLPTAV